MRMHPNLHIHARSTRNKPPTVSSRQDIQRELLNKIRTDDSDFHCLNKILTRKIAQYRNFLKPHFEKLSKDFLPRYRMSSSSMCIKPSSLNCAKQNFYLCKKHKCMMAALTCINYVADDISLDFFKGKERKKGKKIHNVRQKMFGVTWTVIVSVHWICRDWCKPPSARHNMAVTGKVDWTLINGSLVKSRQLEPQSTHLFRQSWSPKSPSKSAIFHQRLPKGHDPHSVINSPSHVVC